MFIKEHDVENQLIAVLTTLTLVLVVGTICNLG